MGAVVGTEVDKTLQGGDAGKLMNVPFNFQDSKNLKENVKNFFQGKPPLPDSTLEEKPAEQKPAEGAEPAKTSTAPRSNGALLPPPQGN